MSKVDDLKKVIKLLVREEVKQVVAEEVNKAMGRILVEVVKEMRNDRPQRQFTETVEEPAPEIIRTRNPKLNSVLAETARHSKPLARTDNLAEIMGGDFEKIGESQEPIYEETQSTRSVPVFDKTTKNMDFLKQMVGDSPLVPQQKSVLDSAVVPDVLKGVFKRDFRKVLKKIDESANTGGSGLINAGQLFSGESDGY